MNSPAKIHFSFRTLTENDLDPILLIQQIVVASLDDPSTLAPLTTEEYMTIFRGNGEIIGAFEGSFLVAIRAVLEPPIDENHLGFHIGLSQEALPQVLYQEISMVLPAYRGHGLQRQLAKRIMKIVDESSKEYTHICATVAPTNIPSLKDKFNQGMYTVVLQKIYGGKWRYTFAKPLQEAWELDDSESKVVPLNAFDEHVHLLEEGWYGVQLTSTDKDFAISYQKLKEDKEN